MKSIILQRLITVNMCHLLQLEITGTVQYLSIVEASCSTLLDGKLAGVLHLRSLYILGELFQTLFTTVLTPPVKLLCLIR